MAPAEKSLWFLNLHGTSGDYNSAAIGERHLTRKRALYTELLVMRCQRGDAAAMEELVRLWERPLGYYMRRLITDHEQSQHAMQEVWLKVLKGVGRLKERKSFAAWAFAITRATAMDHIRNKYEKQTVPIDEDAATDDTDENIAFDDAEQVHSGLAKLSLAHREILTLFFLQDLAIEEIAAVLDISEGTVKSRLHYAKKALKKILTEPNKEHEHD
jgi:RNA polymerase sigma-70 factor, ECF subfamily